MWAQLVGPHSCSLLALRLWGYHLSTMLYILPHLAMPPLQGFWSANHSLVQALLIFPSSMLLPSQVNETIPIPHCEIAPYEATHWCLTPRNCTYRADWFFRSLNTRSSQKDLFSRNFFLVLFFLFFFFLSSFLPSFLIVVLYFIYLFYMYESFACILLHAWLGPMEVKREHWVL